jgi:cyanophycinase-like exopeptidase
MKNRVTLPGMMDKHRVIGKNLIGVFRVIVVQEIEHIDRNYRQTVDEFQSLFLNVFQCYGNGDGRDNSRVVNHAKQEKRIVPGKSHGNYGEGNIQIEIIALVMEYQPFPQ